MEKSTYSTHSETETVFSISDSFPEESVETKSTSTDGTATSIEPVLTMSCLGKLGRFGNQMFQYAFLRICAEKSGSRVECPFWIGQTLFGHKDAPISQQLPPAIERWDMGENLFDTIPELIPYLEKIADAKSSRVGSEALEHGLANVDLWGFFQFHTRLIAPYKEYFRTLFQPVMELKAPLEDSLNILRSKGKTIVGIHIRRGDYITGPQAGFTLAFPAKWYCEWLDGIWNELDNPVLFLCSDELDSILPEFKKFSPVVCQDLEVKIPESMQDLNLEFYLDFFILSNCDVVCISNSTFSFLACMLNEREKIFVRPHWDFSTKFTVFDPWNSEPMLWLGDNKTKFLQSLIDVLYIAYVTQGIRGMFKSIFRYLSKNSLNVWVFRTYLGYQIQGVMGVCKSILYTLGWRFI
ncbi:alpha-1,2-fucosyltransferase [Microcoleus sp. ZQ-A2]|nr:alpha-1,2-fucosyltransferase [Microcoleus sp. FACHB-1]